MKNKKVLVVVVLLLLITITFTSYAIYKSALNADASVTAAKWNVTFKDSTGTTTLTENITFSGAECTNNHVAEGKIAPGATCTKTIILDAGDTEVDVAYSVSAGAVTATVGGNPVSTSGANAFTTDLSPESGTIAYSSSTRTATLTLTVTWAGVDDSNAATADVINTADTSLAGATIVVPVTLTATQVPVTAATR